MHTRVVEVTRRGDKKKYLLQNETEMETFGESLASSLRGGDVIALEGNLGAGKTTLTKGIAKGLGIDPRHVTSPTFVLMNIYAVAKSPSIRQLCHIDTYRLNSPQDLTNIGIQEYLSDPYTVTIIEWPEPALSLLPSNTIYISITLSSWEGKDLLSFV